ncbi:hypothetical protein AB0C52_05400 [Streptomyces sp. NPDC048717]|uniref:hypothetical protein n=1 Tax=Streptomyces sp. NPDC048717 TaxID=3154928 RepID=UPI003421C12C
MAAWDEPYGEPYAGPWTTERVLALGEDRGQRRERVAEAGRETAIEAPFPLKLDPGRLVRPRTQRTDFQPGF